MLVFDHCSTKKYWVIQSLANVYKTQKQPFRIAFVGVDGFEPPTLCL